MHFVEFPHKLNWFKQNVNGYQESGTNDGWCCGLLTSNPQMPKLLSRYHGFSWLSSIITLEDRKKLKIKNTVLFILLFFLSLYQKIYPLTSFPLNMSLPPFFSVWAFTCFK